MQDFIEPDCTFVHDGKAFTANGASVVNNRLIAYLGKDKVLTDWHGNTLGTYKIVSSWRTPRSFVSSTMHQVVALVDGVYYTGRSAGVTMSYVGKRKVKQAWK